MVDYGPRNIGIDWTQTNDDDLIEFRFGPIGDKATSAYFKAFNPIYNNSWDDSPIKYNIRPLDLIRKTESKGNRDLVYEIHKDYQEVFKGARKNILQEFIEVSLEFEKMHLAIGIILSEMSEWLDEWVDGDDFYWDEVSDALNDIIKMVFTSFTEPEGSPFEWPENLPNIEPFTSLLNLITFIVKLLVGTLVFSVFYAIGIVIHIFQLIIFGRGKNLIADLGLMVEDALSGQFKKMGLMFKAHPNEIEPSEFVRGSEWKISPMDFPSKPFAYSNYEIIFGYERTGLMGKHYKHPPQDFYDLRKTIEYAHLYFVKHHMRPVLAIPNKDNPNSQVDMYYWNKDEMYISTDLQLEGSKSEGFIFRLAFMTQKRASYDIIRYCPNLIKTDYKEKPKREDRIHRGIVLIDDGYIEMEHSYDFFKVKYMGRAMIRNAASRLNISKGGFVQKPEADDVGAWNMSLGEHEEGQIRGMENTLDKKYRNQQPDYAFYPTQLLFTIYGFRPPGFVNWYKNPLRTPLQQRVWPPPPPPKPTKRVKGRSRFSKRVFSDWYEMLGATNPKKKAEPEPEPEPLPEPEPEPEPAPAEPQRYYGGYRPSPIHRVMFRERMERQGNENPEE